MKRRAFLGLAAVSGIQFMALASRNGWAVAEPNAEKRAGFGALVDRPGELLDVPEGFTYTVLQNAGTPMSDGYKMPPQPDGMATFMDSDGNYVLLRNHELGNTEFMTRYGFLMQKYGSLGPVFSKDHFGGVARLVVGKESLLGDLKAGRGNPSRALMDSRMVLLGTSKNCSGGTIEGGWVTCEESDEPGHGYAFYTKPTDSELKAPRVIKSWGRMHREAVVMDPRTGVVYMTEDRSDACFFRHVPDNARLPFSTGKVQAMQVVGQSTMDPYPEAPTQGVIPGKWKPGTRFAVTWVDIPDCQAARETCSSQGIRLGATTFNRNEGIVWDQNSAWFISSLGGPVKGGQIFEYVPDEKDDSRGELVLQMEVTDRRVLSCPDNLTLAPWGDVILAEDNYQMSADVTHQFLRGLTREGRVYNIARNRGNGNPMTGRPGAEFTGACFSPDGEVLFVNMQNPVNVTLAIRGPWKKS